MDRLVQRFGIALVLVLLSAVLVSSTALAGPTSFTSDDFNNRNLKRPLWTIADPLAQGTISLRGTNTDSARLAISVPGGSSHDLWTNGYEVPRITQACTNTDFQVDVKYFSSLTGVAFSSYLVQGIVVEHDASNLLRFDFTTGHNKDSVKAFSAAFAGGFASPQVKIDNKFFSGYGEAPLWLRVIRTGNTWKMYYSKDGSAYTLADSFVHAMNVSRIGLFAGNAGPSPSAFTSEVDYFFNADSIEYADDSVPSSDTTPPYVYNVTTRIQPNSMLVSWKTDEPADGQIDWGTTTSYTGTPVTHGGYFTDHRLIVSPLAPATEYHFRINGTDDSAHTDVTADYQITSGTYLDDAALKSDDFVGTSVDAGTWTTVNPLGDATISVVGKQLSIAVPGSIEHDIWTTGYKAPRVLQSVTPGGNVFEWIVKFTNPFGGSATSVQLFGVVVEQDSNNLARFNFSHDGTNLRLYVGAFYDGLGQPDTYTNGIVPISAAPVWLRVVQSGGQFLVYYSTNGTSWTSWTGMIRPMNVTRVGIFAGNAGSAPQAFTATAELVATTLPAKPGLALPLNNAVNVPTPPTMQWDTAASATSYRLQVATDAGFGSVVYNDSTIVLTNKQVAGLNNSTPYYWRVRGKNAKGTGAYSDAFMFTTAVAAPASPALIAPADNAVDQSVNPDLRWTKPAGTVTFRLQVATDSLFVSGIAFDDSTLTDSSRVVAGLANLTKYYWRVNAKNPGGTSAWSAKRAFTTISAIPAAPVLVSPANNAVNQQINVTLRWNRSTGATTYRLQVGIDPTFAGGIVVDDSTLTDTTSVMSGLLNSTQYYWRVNGKNVAGTGAFSAPFTFTTIVADPSIPVLVSPADGATDQDLTVTYTWQTTAGATSYRLQVATDPGFASGIVIDDSTITGTSKTAGGLAYGMRYYWRVNSKNVGGTSPYSSVWNFWTYESDPAVPKQIAPAQAATDVMPPVTVVWTRPAGATSFHLQVGTDSTFAGGMVVNDPAVADTFKSVSGLQYLTSYYWRVNADAVGGTSPYSPVRRFTTGIPAASAPELVYPNDYLRQYTDSMQFVWRQSQPAVDKYWIDLAVDSQFVFVVNDQNVTDTTRLFGSLLPNQTYFWRVRAHNAGGWGPYSVVRRFTRDITSVATRPEIPTEFQLAQNYPNPFNPATVIEFAVPSESRVKLEVYNLIGQNVATLVDEVKSVGYHTVKFDASTLPSGLYLYRMVAGQTSFIRKMMLVK
ncbi:MAG: T9SS type A sorting domain-containing protein [Bacteroidetes bacterium]|nr:T9SS type A sorting domain-containing protein [Bacteroidota bacterium]